MGTQKRNMLIVRSVIDQGMSVVTAAKKCGVSRQWIYTLLHRYRQDGPEGLEPHSRAPRPGRHPPYHQKTEPTAPTTKGPQNRNCSESPSCPRSPETSVNDVSREDMSGAKGN